LSATPLYGVGVDASKKDAVVPLRCVECDANSWYRWSGQSYAVALYMRGEKILLATSERNARLGVFARPSRTATSVTEVLACAAATVITVQGDAYSTRWYFVELDTPARTRGWVPAVFTQEDECGA
jgi:hypothetical protein